MFTLFPILQPFPTHSVKLGFRERLIGLSRS